MNWFYRKHQERKRRKEQQAKAPTVDYHKPGNPLCCCGECLMRRIARLKLVP